MLLTVPKIPSAILESQNKKKRPSLYIIIIPNNFPRENVEENLRADSVAALQDIYSDLVNMSLTSSSLIESSLFSSSSSSSS